MEHKKGKSDLTAYYEDFLASYSKNLFGSRRRSDDSQTSDSSLAELTKKTSSLNVNAPEFVPKLPPSPAQREKKPFFVKKNKHKTHQHHERCCQYCLRRGEDSSMYGSHSLRHPKTKVLICPKLVSNL